MDLIQKIIGDNMLTYGDWFTGFGGMSIGAKGAGLNIIFGAEWREDVAAVYRQNLGDHVRVCDLTAIDISDFPYVDVFHVSPPCPNFSTAKKGAKETENDKNLANAICRYLELRQPKIFTLENVYAYRNSKSWLAIAQTLNNLGYSFKYWHVNMADYGVPQTRRRMIVIARRDGRLPQLPPITHAKKPVNGLFETKKKWVSWYEAVEDLIPYLEETEFAAWQLKLLPSEITEIVLVEGDIAGPRDINLLNTEKPSQTVKVGSNKIPKAFLPHTQVNSATDGRWSNEPATTIAATKNPDKAFLLNGTPNNYGEAITIIDKQDAAFSIVASHNRKMPKAFVMDSNNANSNGRKKYRDANEPVKTLTTSGTVRGFTNGRVVKMNTRCLARFQAFPDWFALPDKSSLACYGIGNAVPPLFAQRFFESLTQ